MDSKEGEGARIYDSVTSQRKLRFRDKMKKSTTTVLLYLPEKSLILGKCPHRHSLVLHSGRVSSPTFLLHRRVSSPRHSYPGRVSYPTFLILGRCPHLTFLSWAGVLDPTSLNHNLESPTNGL